MRTRVFDTSSIVEIKQLPKKVRPRVLAHLDQLVADNLLFFPPQVLGELKRYGDPKDKGGRISDVSLEWAIASEAKATGHGLLLEETKIILSRIPDLIDPERVAPAGVDEADPYVIALAAKLDGAGQEVVVVTEDKVPKPRRTSLSDAAGVFGFPSIGLYALLIYEEGIWDGKEGT